MPWQVRFTFRGQSPPPDEDTFLPTLPQRDDVIWTTPAYLDIGESDERDDAISWRVDEVQMFLHLRRSVAVIVLVPFT